MTDPHVKEGWIVGRVKISYVFVKLKSKGELGGCYHVIGRDNSVLGNYLTMAVKIIIFGRCKF